MAFTQIQKILNPDALSEQFGLKSIIDGYYIVASRLLGASSEVFKRDINGVWNREGQITGSSRFTSHGEYFVTITNTTKELRIYSKTDLSELQLITEAGATVSFGTSVAVNEDYIVVGDEAANSNAGNIYIYEKTGNNIWTKSLDSPLTADIPTADDYFGCAVAINNESIIVGAKGDSQKKGAVYIFQKDVDTGLWEQTQKLFASDGESNDQFGESLSVDGDYFVTGASLKESLNGEVNAGAAYVFKYSTDWYEVDKLVGVDESSYEGNHFGESVYIQGDHIIVGSPSARVNKGVADLFYKKRSWGHKQKIVGYDAEAGDYFGTSVSISGRFIVIGSPYDDDAGADEGAIFIYEEFSILLRLAQEFEVNSQFLPSKASVYLKRVGENVSDYWPLYNTVRTVIDATNFSTIEQVDIDASTTFNINQFQKLIASDAASNDYFGYVVDVSGDYMVVGAYREFDYKGAAYIFYNNPDNPSDEWVEVKKITATDGVGGGAANGDCFGISVAIDGDYIVVGAYNKDEEIGESAGAAYVFYRNFDDPSREEWVEIKKLIASDGKAGDNFGRWVSVSGNYIVVGAPGVDSPAAQSGAAYIFNIDLSNPSNECGEIQKIQSDDISGGDAFGRDVAIEGNYIVVGARRADGLVANTGAAYVFYGEYDNPSDNEWKQIKKLTANDGTADDYFGEAISMSGDYIIVGAYQEDEKGIQAGAAYIYYKNQGGINNWGELKKITASDGDAGDRFGWSVDIDGDYIVVGSYLNDGAGSNRGASYVFNKDSDNNWIEIKKLIAKDAKDDDNFGSGVAISGDCIVMGAYLEDEGGDDAGAAYVFYIKDNTYIGSNIVIFNDTISGFTGNGYMISQDESVPASDFGIINYPIRAINPDTYDLWIRCINTDNSRLEVEILIDGVVSKTINTEIDNPSDGLEWSWVSTSIVIPDSRDHILGIRIKENNVAIDKIYIEVDSSTPYIEGPDYSYSPYLTVHMQVYDSNNGEPGVPLYIYDYKNSITEIIQDDWYNFNIKILDDTHGYICTSDFSENYYLVMSSSGTTPSNFVVWELIDNDEYNAPSSAIKF